jgi:hypothetical protein
MAISVEPAVATALERTTVILQVRSDDDPGRLTAAVRAAATDIAALDAGWRHAPGPRPGDRAGPKYVSGPVPAPDGPLIMIDLGEDLTRELVASVPDLIAGRLREAGVRDAVVSVPARIGDRYGIIRSFAPAARAWLCAPLARPFGDAPRRPPVHLLEIAAQWLRGEVESGAEPGPELRGLIISVETPLTWQTLPAVAGAVLAADSGTPAVVVMSDFATSAAAVGVVGQFRNTVPQATLSAAGAGWTAGDVAARMRRQREAIRVNAGELDWAGIIAEVDARDLTSPRCHDRDVPSVRPPVDMLTDVLVPDAAWYQVLSAGHLRRLGGPPPGAVPLAADRVELTIGEPEQWLPGHPDRDAVRAQGRDLLAGCLVDADEAVAMKRECMQRA